MWGLAIRDTVIFLAGVGLLAKELASRTPDPILVEVGAGLIGVPGVMHHRALRRSTDNTPEHAQQPSHSESESTDT